MMDKKPHIKPYLYGMFAGFGAISLSILFFFLIYRFQGFGNAVSTLTGILMPFIYGSVIAYLLKPVCNWLEAFLHKLFPEKMHRFANMLAVALTILFGLLLIYALIMMIVPQLINSVTALYYTARDNIGDFVEWISKQELIANNKKLLDFIENSYDSLEANLDAWIKNTLLPSMQNILSGAAVGVVNVVTWIKNFVIGLIGSRASSSFIVWSSPAGPTSSWRKSVTLTGCSAASSTARSWIPPSSACCAILPA